MLSLSPVRWRMQTALILEYQKSVGLHTPSHLHTWSRATGSFDQLFDEATGSALRWSLHGWAYIGRLISGTPV